MQYYDQGTGDWYESKWVKRKIKRDGSCWRYIMRLTAWNIRMRHIRFFGMVQNGKCIIAKEVKSEE